MTLPVAILAGGRATRLGELAAATPKCLLDVGGQPFLGWQLALLADQGYHDVALLIGHLGDQVEAAIGDGGRWGVSVRYVADGETPRGTGGALRRALAGLGGTAFMLYGDAYLRCDYAAVEVSYRTSGQPALMTVFRNDGQWDRSNVQFTDGAILRYDKRNPDRAMHHIDWGLGVFSATAFDGAGPDPLDLGTVQASLAERGRLAACEVTERFHEIGSPDGLAAFRALMADNRQPSTPY